MAKDYDGPERRRRTERRSGIDRRELNWPVEGDEAELLAQIVTEGTAGGVLAEPPRLYNTFDEETGLPVKEVRIVEYVERKFRASSGKVALQQAVEHIRTQERVRLDRQVGGPTAQVATIPFLSHEWQYAMEAEIEADDARNVETGKMKAGELQTLRLKARKTKGP